MLKKNIHYYPMDIYNTIGEHGRMMDTPNPT